MHRHERWPILHLAPKKLFLAGNTYRQAFVFNVDPHQVYQKGAQATHEVALHLWIWLPLKALQPFISQ